MATAIASRSAGAGTTFAQIDRESKSEPSLLLRCTGMGAAAGAAFGVVLSVGNGDTAAVERAAPMLAVIFGTVGAGFGFVVGVAAELGRAINKFFQRPAYGPNEFER